MLQEVCCTEKTNSMWSAEWGYIAIFSGVPSNHCGFALPFNIPFSFKIQKSLSLFATSRQIRSVALWVRSDENDDFDDMLKRMIEILCEECWSFLCLVLVEPKGPCYRARVCARNSGVSRILSPSFYLIVTSQVI